MWQWKWERDNGGWDWVGGIWDWDEVEILQTSGIVGWEMVCCDWYYGENTWLSGIKECIFIELCALEGVDVHGTVNSRVLMIEDEFDLEKELRDEMGHVRVKCMEPFVTRPTPIISQRFTGKSDLRMILWNFQLVA